MGKSAHLRLKKASVFKKAEIDHLRATLKELGFDLGKIIETGDSESAEKLKCGTHSCEGFSGGNGPTRCNTEACDTQACRAHGCDTQSCDTEACGSHICDVHEKSFGALMSQMTSKNPTFAALSQALEVLKEPEGGMTLFTADGR